jgi:hypothetical protein
VIRVLPGSSYIWRLYAVTDRLDENPLAEVFGAPVPDVGDTVMLECDHLYRVVERVWSVRQHYPVEVSVYAERFK